MWGESSPGLKSGYLWEMFQKWDGSCVPAEAVPSVLFLGGCEAPSHPQALLPAYLWGQALDPSQALLAFCPAFPCPQCVSQALRDAASGPPVVLLPCWDCLRL